MKNKFDLTIIIPTINSPVKIQKLLNQLDNQNFLLKKTIEILIILQGNISYKKEIIFQNLKNISIINITKKSLSKAKNIGIKNASARLLVFLDDDVSVDNNYLKNIFSFFKKNKNTDILFGSIKIDGKNKYYSRYMKNHASKINILNLKKCLGSAMIIRNRAKNIYFDERFGIGSRYPSSEETDLIIENISNNFTQIIYDPRIIILHPDDELMSKNLNKLKVKFFSYGLGSGAMYAKHLQKNFYFLLFFLFELFKSIIGIILSLVKFNKFKLYKHFYLFNGKIKGFFKYLHSE